MSARWMVLKQHAHQEILHLSAAGPASSLEAGALPQLVSPSSPASSCLSDRTMLHVA